MKKTAIIFAFILLAVIFLSSCQPYIEPTQTGPQGATGATGPQGPAGVVPTPVSSSTITVAELVQAQNQYRESVGQEDLIPGLACTLYTVPTTTGSIVGATLTAVGSFEYNGQFNVPNQSVSAGLNILPAGLQSVYQTWYVVKCYGSLVLTDDSWHSFSLSSDDGANLYVDGLLINNDGMHAVQTKTASKFLQYGFHSFELDYLQGQGNEALILNEDGSVMPSNNFFH